MVGWLPFSSKGQGDPRLLSDRAGMGLNSQGVSADSGTGRILRSLPSPLYRVDLNSLTLELGRPISPVK